MIANTTKRQSCEIAHTEDLEDLYTLKDFPVFMGCVDGEKSEDKCHDMTWSISKSSGFLQLRELLPLELVYSMSHNAGVVGKVWDEHHESFAEFIRGFAPKHVLEIGGGSGILSYKYHDKEDIKWHIVEPNPTPVKGCKAEFIEGFFDEKFSLDEKIDTIVHSHVFEHIYKPDEFIFHIGSFVKNAKGGGLTRMVFSLPNMQAMLERNYTNCINFEHTIFLTEPYIEHLLSKYGFKIEKKEYFLAHHSIFYSAIYDEAVEPVKLDKSLYEKNKSLYLSYVKYHKDLIEEINQKIQKSSQKIYLFGAHIFAQYLIGFGLNTSKIEFILDNDKDKQGKRLYGTNLQVRSPKILKDEPNPYIILKAGIYNDEIKKDILANINPNSIFLE